MSRFLRLFLIPIIALPLSGCLGDLMGVVCDFLPDADHCNQSAAVQNGDPYGCEKIKGKGFKGSNPPRDKCYLMIAENTGDFEACDFIRGGPLSYTKEQCVTGTAVKHEDPEGCRNLSGAEFNRCKGEVGATITSDKLKEINDELEEAKSAAGKNPDDAEAQKKYKELLAKEKTFFEFASDGAQKEYFKQEREAIMEDVEDEDVKSEIAKLFIEARKENPNMTVNEQLKKMEEIKDRQETVKNLDEQVNEVFDEMKDSISDFVSENVDEATGASEFAEKMQEKGVEWFKENGGDRVKRGIENLEWMKGKYDKASEQYEKISGQIEKLKKVYDEANEVYTKIDKINKLVAEGKLDKGKAGVLHGAVLLGKGLEYTTGYVPVFGSTISKISKATFEETVKFATKRAQRTTALDKCIDDPLNCDTEGISGY